MVSNSVLSSTKLERRKRRPVRRSDAFVGYPRSRSGIQPLPIQARFIHSPPVQVRFVQSAVVESSMVPKSPTGSLPKIVLTDR